MAFNSQFAWVLSFVGLSYMLGLSVFFAVLIYRFEHGLNVTIKNGATAIRLVKGCNFVGLFLAAIWLFPLVTRLFKQMKDQPADMPAIVFILTVVMVIGVFSWAFGMLEKYV